MLDAASFFFSSRRRHTRCLSDWSSDVCSSDLRRFMTGDYAGRTACKPAAGRLYHRKYGGIMPSSKDRRRLEVPKYLHEQLEQRSEERRVGKECRSRGTP